MLNGHLSHLSWVSVLTHKVNITNATNRPLPRKQYNNNKKKGDKRNTTRKVKINL